MSFLKLTRPDNSTVLINTDNVLNCAPVPESGPLVGPSPTGTRIVFTNATHQDVLELIDQVLSLLNAARGQH